MSSYKVRAKDSAGTEFQLGTSEEAIKMLAIVKSAEQRRLPVRDLVVEAPDGTVIDRAQLTRLAQEEVHALALVRAGRAHVSGRPPGE